MGHAAARLGLLPLRRHQGHLQSVARHRRSESKLAQGEEEQQRALRHAEYPEVAEGSIHRGGVHHAPHHATQHHRRGLHRGAQTNRNADQKTATT